MKKATRIRENEKGENHQCIGCGSDLRKPPPEKDAFCRNQSCDQKGKRQDYTHA